MYAKVKKKAETAKRSANLLQMPQRYTKKAVRQNRTAIILLFA